MPDVGLAKASNVVAVGDSTTARNRLKTTKAWRPVGCDPTVSPTAASRPLFVGQRVPDPGEESRTSSTRPRCASRSALRDHRPFATGRSPRGRHPRGRSPERRVPTRRGRRVRARARAARRWFGRVRWTCASPSPRQRDRRPSRVDLRRGRTGRTVATDRRRRDRGRHRHSRGGEAVEQADVVRRQAVAPHLARPGSSRYPGDSAATIDATGDGWNAPMNLRTDALAPASSIRPERCASASGTCPR